MKFVGGCSCYLFVRLRTSNNVYLRQVLLFPVLHVDNILILYIYNILYHVFPASGPLSPVNHYICNYA